MSIDSKAYQTLFDLTINNDNTDQSHITKESIANLIGRGFLVSDDDWETFLTHNPYNFIPDIIDTNRWLEGDLCDTGIAGHATNHEAIIDHIIYEHGDYMTYAESEWKYEMNIGLPRYHHGDSFSCLNNVGCWLGIGNEVVGYELLDTIVRISLDKDIILLPEFFLNMVNNSVHTYTLEQISSFVPGSKGSNDHFTKYINEFLKADIQIFLDSEWGEWGKYRRLNYTNYDSFYEQMGWLLIYLLGYTVDKHIEGEDFSWVSKCIDVWGPKLIWSGKDGYSNKFTVDKSTLKVFNEMINK